MSQVEAPEELWMRLTRDGRGFWVDTDCHEAPAVRYVRADIYEAVVERLLIAQQQAPLGTDNPR